MYFRRATDQFIRYTNQTEQQQNTIQRKQQQQQNIRNWYGYGSCVNIGYTKTN